MDATANITPTAHIAGAGAYNPYSGKEVLDIVMKRIYAQLKEHQDFALHLSYTKFEVDFTLTLKTEALIPTTTKGKQSYGIRPTESNHTVVVISEPAPDTMRRDNGLTVPQPTLTAGGMVDIPLQAQMPQP